jgi:hypothetical protein
MKRKGIVWQTLIPWLIALGVLVLVLFLYWTLNDKGTGILENLKTALRFGR